MIMLSPKLTGEVPFTEVYCHSLIRDSEGRKMSKSLGNVIDPLDIINGIKLDSLHAKLLTGNLKEDEVERTTKYQKTAFLGGIPECGADALRFTLLSYTTGGSDINFDIKVMHAYRRFCNKVWQTSKYVLGKLPEQLSKTNIAITKQKELMGREGFDKVSDIVLTAEKKKLVDVQAAKDNYERTLAEFSKLQLGDN